MQRVYETFEYCDTLLDIGDAESIFIAVSCTL